MYIILLDLSTTPLIVVCCKLRVQPVSHSSNRVLLCVCSASSVLTLIHSIVYCCVLSVTCPPPPPLLLLLELILLLLPVTWRVRAQTVVNVLNRYLSIHPTYVAIHCNVPIVIVQTTGNVRTMPPGPLSVFFVRCTLVIVVSTPDGAGTIGLLLSWLVVIEMDVPTMREINVPMK